MSTAFLKRTVQRPAPPPPPEPEPIVEAWPIYFCRTSLDGVRNPLKAGQLFPAQDKRDVRLWAQAFGMTDEAARQRPFSLLPFVTVVCAPTRSLADKIVADNMSLDEARRFLNVNKDRHGKR